MFWLKYFIISVAAAATTLPVYSQERRVHLTCDGVSKSDSTSWGRATVQLPTKNFSNSTLVLIFQGKKLSAVALAEAASILALINSEGTWDLSNELQYFGVANQNSDKSATFTLERGTGRLEGQGHANNGSRVYSWEVSGNCRVKEDLPPKF